MGLINLAFLHHDPPSFFIIFFRHAQIGWFRIENGSVYIPISTRKYEPGLARVDDFHRANRWISAFLRRMIKPFSRPVKWTLSHGVWCRTPPVHRIASENEMKIHVHPPMDSIFPRLLDSRHLASPFLLTARCHLYQYRFAPRRCKGAWKFESTENMATEMRKRVQRT